MNILFVCTGNICRSPIAERLLDARARTAGLSAIRSASAGTRAMVNHPIHPASADALTALGGDPSNFRARQITKGIVLASDVILTMTNSHRDAVLGLAPQALSKTFLLTEASALIARFGACTFLELHNFRSHLRRGERPDIPDPIGLDPDYHSRVALQIDECLCAIVSLLAGAT